VRSRYRPNVGVAFTTGQTGGRVPRPTALRVARPRSGRQARPSPTGFFAARQRIAQGGFRRCRAALQPTGGWGRASWSTAAAGARPS